jgi:hypothetical protein
MPQKAELTVKVVGGPKENLVLQVENLESFTVLQLKELLFQQNPEFPIEAQRLIFQGQILQNEKLLNESQISDGCALHLSMNRSAMPSSTTVTAGINNSGVTTQQQPHQLLRGFLEQMRHETGFLTAVQTLQKICQNIISHPNEEKYRKLRLENASLKTKLFDLSKGMDCVKVLGFQDGIEQGFIVLVPSADKWEALQASKRVLDEFVSRNNNTTGAFGGRGGIGGEFGGVGAGPGGPPNLTNMASQAQAMLQNPMMAQMIENDPMIQQMAQMNPMIAQALRNPALLGQSLQMLQQNPAMMQQMQSMLQDPNAVQAMRQMMLEGGGGLPFGNVGGAGDGAGPGIFGSTNNNTTAPNPFSSIPTAPVAYNPFATHSSTTPPTTTTSATPASASSTGTPSGSNDNDTNNSQSGDGSAASFDEDEVARAIAHSLQEQ